MHLFFLCSPFFEAYVIQVCIAAEYIKLQESGLCIFHVGLPQVWSQTVMSENCGACQTEQRPRNFSLGISLQLGSRTVDPCIPVVLLRGTFRPFVP